MKIKVIILALVFQAITFGDHAGIDSVLLTLTPFNDEELADTLARKFETEKLLPYLISTNPLIIKCMKKAISSSENYKENFGRIERITDGRIRIQLLASFSEFIDKNPEDKDPLFLEKLILLSSHENNGTRRVCADLLQYFPGEKTISVLRDLLDDNDIRVKIYAVNSLRILKDNGSEDLLMKLIETDDPYLKYTVENALKEFDSN